MTDMTIKLLQQIRDEMKSTRVDLSQRIDQTNHRLDETNHRLDRLEHRQTETEVRLATEIVSVSGAIADLKNVILEDRHMRTQLSNHESRIKALERKRTA